MVHVVQCRATQLVAGQSVLRSQNCYHHKHYGLDTINSAKAQENSLISALTGHIIKIPKIKILYATVAYFKLFRENYSCVCTLKLINDFS